MTLFTFDLNDMELRLFRGGQLAAESSGFAFIHASSGAPTKTAAVEYGDGARRQARLHPRQASNQHWHRLAMDPLAIRGPNLANLADLVYGQLGELVRRAGMGPADELFVTAPATVTPDQLGLLLGVAQELGIKVTGLADSGVAASTQSTLSGQFVHVDLSLHRATLTSLDATDGVMRTAAQEIPDAGLSHLIDGWVNVVANRFVAETRFDPLRIAETEQQVYNQVHDWLAAAERNNELIVEASHRDALRRVTVPMAALIDKAVSRLRPLSDAVPAHGVVVLSHRAARIPGLRERLGADHVSLDVLPSDALVRGVEDNVERIRSDPKALKLVTKLARRAPHAPAAQRAQQVPAAPIAEPGPRAPTDVRLPSHVLHRGRARAIGTRLLVGAIAFPEPARPSALPERVATVEQANDGAWVRPIDGAAATLNGRPLQEPTRARIGDVLRLGEHEFVLIRVLDSEAP